MIWLNPFGELQTRIASTVPREAPHRLPPHPRVPCESQWEALVGVRKARLRPEYASWYPNISVAGWIPARTVARAVKRQLIDHEPRWAPRWELGARLLDDQHFMFRDGEPHDPQLRTRAEDNRQREEVTSNKRALE